MAVKLGQGEKGRGIADTKRDYRYIEAPPERGIADWVADKFRIGEKYGYGRRKREYMAREEQWHRERVKRQGKRRPGPRYGDNPTGV